MVGVAVKVTLVPAQIAPLGLAAMLTAGVTVGVIVMLIGLLDAGQLLVNAADETVTGLGTLLAKLNEPLP